MNDMTIKFIKENFYDPYPTSVFNHIWKYNMILNPEKCTFGIRSKEFLAFYLTKKGIEANPNKCDVIIKIKSLTTNKKTIKPNGILIAIRKFI